MVDFILKLFNKFHNILKSNITTGEELHKRQTALLVILTLLTFVKLIYSLVIFDIDACFTYFSLFVVLFYYSMSFNEVLNEIEDDESDQD